MKIERLLDVKGLSVAVTGGASGIGLAIAPVFAENGARVTIADLDGIVLDTAVAALGARMALVR